MRFRSQGVRFRLAGSYGWLKRNGEAIYSTRPITPYEQGDCVFTRKRDGTVYAIILAKDDAEGLPESVRIPPEIAAQVGRIELLGVGPLKADADGVIQIPAEAQAHSKGGLAWAIKLKPKG